MNTESLNTPSRSDAARSSGISSIRRDGSYGSSLAGVGGSDGSSESSSDDSPKLSSDGSSDISPIESSDGSSLSAEISDSVRLSSGNVCDISYELSPDSDTASEFSRETISIRGKEASLTSGDLPSPDKVSDTMIADMKNNANRMNAFCLTVIRHFYNLIICFNYMFSFPQPVFRYCRGFSMYRSASDMRNF